MAGVYEHFSPTASATAIIDEQGRMLVSSGNQVYHPDFSMARYVDFSGKALLTGSGGWIIPDALMYARETAGPPPVETSWTMPSATITGTFTSDQGLTTHIGLPPAPMLYQNTFVYQRKQRVSDGPIAMSVVTGRYTSLECSGSPRNPGPCTVVTDYSIEASGRISGRLTAAPLPACAFEGNVVVAQAQARVLRATGTFTSTVAGVVCPAGTSVLLGAFDGAAPSYSLTWYFTQTNGRVNITTANKSPPTPVQLPVAAQGLGVIQPGIYAGPWPKVERGPMDDEFSTFLLVHPDGLFAGNGFTFDYNTNSGTSFGFIGATTPSATGAVGPLATLIVNKTAENSIGSRTGTVNVSLTQPASSTLGLELSDATIGAPFSKVTYNREVVNSNVSLQELAGTYDDGSIVKPTGTDIVIDPVTGNIAGTYNGACRMDGRLYAFDNASGVFRIDATFLGTCGGGGRFGPPVGSGQFLGFASRYYDDSRNIEYLILRIYAIAGDQTTGFDLWRVVARP